MAIRLYVNALGRHPGPGRCRVKFRDTEFTSEAMFQVTEASLTCPGQKLSLAHWQDVFILGTSSLKAPGQLPLLRRSVRSRAWAGPLPARPAGPTRIPAGRRLSAGGRGIALSGGRGIAELPSRGSSVTCPCARRIGGRQSRRGRGEAAPLLGMLPASVRLTARVGRGAAGSRQ